MILYQDAALVVVNKPAGLSSEVGLPPGCGAVGAAGRLCGHRCTGWTPVYLALVYSRTPKAAATSDTAESPRAEEAYAVLDGRAAPAQNTLPARSSPSSTRPTLPGTGRNAAGTRHPAGLSVQGQPEGAGSSRSAARARGAGSRARIPHRHLERNTEPCGHHPPHRADPSDPGAVRLPAASALGRRQIRQPFQGNRCTASRELFPPGPGSRWSSHWKSRTRHHGTFSILLRQIGPPIFAFGLNTAEALLSGERSYGTTNVQNRRHDL